MQVNVIYAHLSHFLQL